MEAGVVLDEDEEVANVPFLTEQNADVPPAVHHQQGIEEMGRWGLHGSHCHLEVERILWGDCKRGVGVMGDDWASGCERFTHRKRKKVGKDESGRQRNREN